MRVTSRPRALAFACCLVLLAAGLTLRVACTPAGPLDSSEALLERLQAAGLDYEGRFVPW